ncbi:uncharacterized protein DFL_004651 [Arthrobotrys flagrans]|uniref:CBM1 domain-containing protein n=1 Tax=Arthrobotrys flagrans TaxID=97331 RepID=A0A437A587_ARTFL|nr:hypothetical protein DFL_004651 [Arthrobotrys flagrans]
MKFTIAFVAAALASVVAATGNVADCQGTANLRPVYAQCDGLQYGGCNKCVPTATCTYVNDYYSQCYPKPQ